MGGSTRRGVALRASAGPRWRVLRGPRSRRKDGPEEAQPRMFTGIVEELGEVVSVERLDEAARITVRGPRVTADARPGDSMAVNGTCLTVTGLSGADFTADVMAETLSRTGLGALAPGSPVNLERSLRVGDRLGGHMVQGHVDGVSLTISALDTGDGSAGQPWFEVSLIPATLAGTTLGRAAPGSLVNLEADVIGKYVERMLGGHAAAARS